VDAVTFAAIVALWVAPQGLRITSYMPIREVASSATSTDLVDRWSPFIAEAARRFAIPEAWIRAVMRAESGGQTVIDGRPITSPAGAMGLMQLIPETYADLRRRFGLGPDPHDPHDNIIAGATYLRQMFDRYGYPALFAAHNAGPERFEAYAEGDENLPAETWNYLAKLGPGIAETVLAMGSVSVPAEQEIARSETPKQPDFSSGRALFFVLGDDGKSGLAATKPVPGSTNIAARNGSLFVSRSDQITPPNEPANRLLFVPLAGEPR
jgi:Transglycosylase SLT domain